MTHADGRDLSCEVKNDERSTDVDETRSGARGQGGEPNKEDDP